VSATTTLRRDPWRCARCGRPAELGRLTLELGLVRLALDADPERFRLGSAGIEPAVAELLAPCACGGRLEPGAGEGEPIEPELDADALREPAARGWAALEASGGARLAELRRLWRPRALLLLGRGGELGREEQLRLRLEGRLEALHEEMEAARRRGDDDAAEAAHARYIELGTTYVRRFLLADEPASRAS
jgi:hypothetical protein